MKSSVAVMAAAATLAMAKPSFLNSNFDITPGKEFLLKFDGCDEGNGCTIDLLKGDPKNLDVVQTLVTDTTAGEQEITLSDKFPTDKYAFRITDSNDEVNYSDQFDFEGAAPVETTTSAEETTTSTSSEEETTTAEESTTEEMSTTTTTDTETVSTPASTTESDSPTPTDEDESAQTSDDDSAPEEDAAMRLGASYVSLAAAVAALVGYVL